MQLYQLRYLIEITQTGSINKAAQNLFISQPNLSNSIMALEKEFNIKIFDRTNRGVKLTEEGRDFLIGAKYILNSVKNIKNIYSNRTKEESFVLKASSAKILNLALVLIDVYKNIHCKKIKISLKETHKEQIIQDVANMDSEIGLLIISNLEEKIWKNILDINKLEFNEITKDRVYISLGKNNPLYNNKEIHPHELKDLVCVNLVEEPITSFTYGIDLNSLDVLNKDKNIYLNDNETIINFLRETNAYTFVSEWGMKNQIEGIKAIPLSDESIYFIIGWIKRKNENLSPEAKIFLKTLLNKLSS